MVFKKKEVNRKIRPPPLHACCLGDELVLTAFNAKEQVPDEGSNPSISTKNLDR